MSASTATPTSPEILRGVVGIRGQNADDVFGLEEGVRHDYDLFHADPQCLADDIRSSALTFDDSTLSVVALRSNMLSGGKGLLGAVAQLKRAEDSQINVIELDIVDDRSHRLEIIELILEEVEQAIEPGDAVQFRAWGAFMCVAAQENGYTECLGQQNGFAILKKELPPLDSGTEEAPLVCPRRLPPSPKAGLGLDIQIPGPVGPWDGKTS